MRVFSRVIARFALSSAVLVAAWSAPAFAQRAGSEAGRGGANGVKVGEARLHPFVDIEPRMDSAAGFFTQLPGGGLSSTPSPELVLHVRPGVKFELPSPTVALDVNANADFLYYTGVMTPGSTISSRLQGAANINAGFNREGQLGFELGDEFSYSDRTNNTALGVGVLSLNNEVRAQVPYKPGGGALEISPKGAFAFEQYRPVSYTTPPGCAPTDVTCQPTLVSNMNYQNIRLGVDGRWRFLPKTAIVVDTTLDLRRYPAITNLPATLLKATMGVQGLLTTKVSVVAKLGWGYDFAGAAGGNGNTFLAHAEATYLLNTASNFKAGYFRSLEPVAIYGTFQDDRLYGELRMLFSGRMVARTYVAWDLITFGASSNRVDTAFVLDPSVEYEVTPWLYAATGYSLSTRTSGGASPSTTAAVNFTRHEAYLRLTAVY